MLTVEWFDQNDGYTLTSDLYWDNLVEVPENGYILIKNDLAFNGIVVNYDTGPKEEIQEPSQLSMKLDGPFQYSGLGFLLCNQDDLILEYYDIVKPHFLGEGQTSHIKTILQSTKIIENYCLKKFNLSSILTVQIKNARLACVYLTLHKIFNNASDAVDDKWNQKAQYYLDMYKSELDQIEVDKNSDGTIDEQEKQKFKTIILRR